MRGRWRTTARLGAVLFACTALAQEAAKPDDVRRWRAEAEEHMQAGRWAQALPALERMRECGEASGDGRARADALYRIAVCQNALGRPELALESARGCLVWARADSGGHDSADVARALRQVADALRGTGKHREAVEAYEEAIEIWRRIAPGGDLDLALALQGASDSHEKLGEPDVAIAEAEESVSSHRRISPDPSPHLAGALAFLGGLDQRLGRGQQAVDAITDEVKVRRAIHDGDDPGLADSLIRLALALQKRGAILEALRSAEEAVEMSRRLFQGDRDEVASALATAGSLALAAGKRDAAARLLEEAAGMWKRLGREESAALRALPMLAIALAATSRRDEAVSCLQELTRILENCPGTADRTRAIAFLNAGTAFGQLGRFEDAVSDLKQAWRVLARSGDTDPDAWTCASGLARCLQETGRLGEALHYGEKAVAGARASGSARQLAIHLSLQGATLDAAGRSREALALHREANTLMAGIADLDDGSRSMIVGSLGSCLARLGRLREALVELDRALAIDRLRPDSAEFSTALNNVAWTRLALGEYADARSLFEEALALSRKQRGDTHPRTLHMVGNLAECLTRMGSRDEARSLFERAIQGTPEERLDRVWYLGGLGRLLRMSGHPSQALELHRKALDLAEKLHEGDHPLKNYAMLGVAYDLCASGRPAEALAQARGALAMARRMQDGDQRDALDAVAGCLRDLGRRAEALQEREEVLAMDRRLYAGDHPETAAALRNLAGALCDVGRAADALPLAEEALAMDKRLYGDETKLVGAFNSLALCLYALERKGEAEEHLQRALAMQRDRHEDAELAALLLNLGQLRQSVGRDAEALPCFREALAILRRLDPAEDWKHAYAEASIAKSLRALGKTREAREGFENALAKARGKHAITTLSAARGLGCLHLDDLHDPEAALPYLREAIGVVEEQRATARSLTPSDLATFTGFLRTRDPYADMVRALLALGRNTEAFDYLERGRARTMLDLLERSSFDPMQAALERARRAGDRALATEIEGASGAVEEAERAQRTAQSEGERAAARARLAAARRRRARLVADVVPFAAPATAENLRPLLGAHGLLLAYLFTDEGGRLLVVPPPGRAVEVHELSWPDGGAVTRENLAKAVDSYGSAMREEGRRARGVQVMQPVTAPQAGELGRRLFDALVPPEVWKEVRAADRLLLLPDGPLHLLPMETLRAPDGAYWLDAAPPTHYAPSGSVLRWCARRRDEQRSTGGAVVLGDPRFAMPEPPPLPEAGAYVLRGGGPLRAGDVIVAYDGRTVVDHRALREAVDRVRYEIEDGERGQGDVELEVWREGAKVELRADIGPLGVEVAREPPAVAWRGGAAVERGDGRGPLAPLPGTRAEARAIASALDGTVLLLGEEATEPALFAAAPKARYLHLATHLLADETEGASFTALALTAPARPTAEDDGFLRLSDLFEHWRDRLAGCELVVLSACETQRGPLQRDEAPFAMPVGFLYAGAPSVIASLWPVDDASTAELFAGFYKRLRDGKGKLKAFTEARKALKKKYPEPYFWAPFVYVGDPR